MEQVHSFIHLLFSEINLNKSEFQLTKYLGLIGSFTQNLI